MNDYSLRILYILNLEEMTSYGLSKKLYNSSSGKNISNGALFPVLNKLLSDKFIDFKLKNEKKYYYLTEKGKKFVSNILDLNEEVKDQAIFDAIDSEFPYINVFTDINDYSILKDVIKEIGHPVIEIIRQAFYLKKNNNEEGLDSIKKMLDELLKNAKKRNSNINK